ncbi:hypothetical protein DE146DRAFT_792784 [Phaeosphaeria sp. MPI-PUGE-AT-0046c]|nr:hypothetical protein DE146DRAFT_792784 [Phaeosphaeria sp. MPI-PUGE-AT-0046c]
MCDMLVFAASDIAPEASSDFIKAADLTDDVAGKGTPPADPTPPYTLVHSRSQEDFSRTGELAYQVKIDFSDAAYAKMAEFGENICKADKTRLLISIPFMVLDAKSGDDRKVVVIGDSLRTLHAEDENEQIGLKGPDEIVWTRHCVPFEKVAFFSLVMRSQPGDEGYQFLQNTTIATLDGL